MQKRQRPDCIFSKLNTQPTCTPVYASPNTSRCATQNSGPSGSLLLSRRTLSFPASCRFIPAHYKGDCTYYSIPIGGAKSEYAVWTYENPYKTMASIKEHLAFYPSRVDAIKVIS
jgi:hypothetical protein